MFLVEYQNSWSLRAVVGRYDKRPMTELNQIAMRLQDSMVTLERSSANVQNVGAAPQQSAKLVADD